jgi:collagen type I/II/III/V/XI/XXIV/XXVII alpha
MTANANNKTLGTWSALADWTSGATPIATDIVTLTDTGSPTTYTINAAANPIAGLALVVASKAMTLSMVSSASLQVNGNVSLTSGGTTSATAAKIIGVGSLNVTGAISGNGTISGSGGTLNITAASMNSTMTLLGAAAGTLNVSLTGSSTVSAISVSGNSTVQLSAGVLTTTGFLNGNLVTGTILVAGTARLNVTNTFSVSAAQTLKVSGGTISLTAGGTLGTGGVVFADVAGSTFITGGSLTTGNVFFASTGGNAQTLQDTLGTALVGRTINNFKGSDTIVVAGAVSYKVISGGGTATGTIGAIASGGGTIEVLSFAGGATFSANNTVISGGTLTGAAACYLAGTKILTTAGDVAVEDLAIGDLLITADGSPQAIRWIGQRAYLARLVNEHHRAGLMPVRFTAGSLGDNVPTRDLFVSPEHMMALDGVLVAAHNLVNGSTITRFQDIDVVKYFHIELDQHGVIFAEGAAAESYLDTGNRNMFTNVLDYAELGTPIGSTLACLPIVSEGSQLAAIRAGIADRAEACGFTTSADADLHLLVDGVTIYPSVINGQSFSFDIAQSASDVRIVSRSAVPAEIDPASADRRRLGVAMGGLTLRGNGLSIDVLAGEKLLAEGFYPADAGHRWTNGAAPIPAALLALMDGAFSVTVQLVGTGMRYSVADHGGVFALASVRAPRSAGAQRRVA